MEGEGLPLGVQNMNATSNYDVVRKIDTILQHIEFKRAGYKWFIILKFPFVWHVSCFWLLSIPPGNIIFRDYRKRRLAWNRFMNRIEKRLLYFYDNNMAYNIKYVRNFNLISECQNLSNNRKLFGEFFSNLN